MTVHDASIKKTRLTGQLHTLKKPHRRGFCIMKDEACR
ncbi:hypothetical protein P262_05215 [Cronobacter malonaticus]|uniref:Uncharacterized protein n=1 Tax=Cronobacter malonaticus TaxID=413503 RepID=V5U3W4_9ENTR|nr:hypothetical protein P262_05215 [Cronobacter malonaticus]